VITSVSRANLGELEAIRDYLMASARGFTWMINIASPRADGRMGRDEALDADGVRRLSAFIHDSRRRCRPDLDVTATHDLGYFSRRYPDLHSFTWQGCEAGLKTLGIRSDGDVLGCLILEDPFVEDNLRRRRLKEIWNDPDAFAYNRRFSIELLQGACRGCEHGEICRGGCRDHAHAFTGAMYHYPFCLHRMERGEPR
jgi:radical SAM protein with 4Fe4S-binding SPASM domain